ncbi:MAG: GNAT family N-acetyltransferase [Candidatus Binatia bacterium]
MSPPEVIKTKRLQLRRPVMEDAKPIFQRYAQDAEVTRYLGWRPHQTLATTWDFLHRCRTWWEHGTAFSWVILRQDDKQPLGMIELRIEGHRATVGYALARTAWNQGFATEAAQAIVEWALAQPSIYRVWAFCDVENKASARVLEKVGMRREGVLRRWMIHPNCSSEPRDCYCYALTK